MTKEKAIKYIKHLAINSYDMDGDDIEEFIAQLELENVIEIKVNDK